MRKKIFAALAFSFFVSQAYGQAAVSPLELTPLKWTELELPSVTALPKVNLRLTYNDKALVIKATVLDKHFKDGDRSWRYGDGFFINFVTPDKSEKDSSTKFYSFGFSMENKKPIGILVNKDGVYFPKLLQPPRPELTIDTAKMIADYTITIPWQNLAPFNPLIETEAGINIIYISQNDDRSRIIQKLVDDNYDTESTKFRKFLPVKFSPALLPTWNMAGKISNPLIDSRNTRVLLFIRSPKMIKTKILYEIIAEDSSILRGSLFKLLTPGVNKLNHKLKLPKKSGLLRINYKINDSVSWSGSIYSYNKSSLQQSLEIIKLLADSASNGQLHLSGNTLLYRIKSLLYELDNFTERDDINSLKERFDETSSLIELFRNEKTILKKSGYLLAAFRSPRDSTLQPFSFFLPEKFDPARVYNALFILHGSGVDEVANIKFAARNFSDTNLILIAPRGRDLSSWYTGKTEEDIIDLTREIKSILNIDRIILYGFSMGGYGVWRFGLLYPNLFDAGIVLSGIPFNIKDEKPEYNLNNFSNYERKIPFFVVHGTVDNSLDIMHTDAFVEKLKSGGFDIRYLRVEGGGHGNFNPSEGINAWLKEKNFIGN